MTARDAIRTRLTTYCTSFTGGFWEPEVADENTVKPFGVIRFAGDTPEFRQGIVRRVQVMVHCARESHGTLDALCLEVRNALNDVKISAGTGLSIYMTHVGTTADARDDDRETIFKIMEFELPLGG